MASCRLKLSEKVKFSFDRHASRHGIVNLICSDVTTPAYYTAGDPHLGKLQSQPESYRTNFFALPHRLSDLPIASAGSRTSEGGVPRAVVRAASGTWRFPPCTEENVDVLLVANLTHPPNIPWPPSTSAGIAGQPQKHKPPVGRAERGVALDKQYKLPILAPGRLTARVHVI